ncbi:MAG: hemolysin III family protein [Clostridia bacterium]|nr:hemolysin III family protein [Clostridia bacterium]
MKRTPLKDRILPNYTTGEELANMITHIVGGGIGVLITLACILVASIHRNVYGIVSGCIYGFTLIALYTVSSVYHGLKPPIAKKVFQVIDHCTIYFLIAGTYTPILLSAIRVHYPAMAWIGFGIEWGLAFTAAALTAIDLKKYNALSMICYIGMGWFVIFFLKVTISSITMPGFLWLLAGGISYTIGAVLYGIGARKRYFHTVFHVFVDMGSLLQAVCILRYVL